MSQCLAQLGSAFATTLTRFLLQLCSLQRQYIGHRLALHTTFSFLQLSLSVRLIPLLNATQGD